METIVEYNKDQFLQFLICLIDLLDNELIEVSQSIITQNNRAIKNYKIASPKNLINSIVSISGACVMAIFYCPDRITHEIDSTLAKFIHCHLAINILHSIFSVSFEEKLLGQFRCKDVTGHVSRTYTERKILLNQLKMGKSQFLSKYVY